MEQKKYWQSFGELNDSDAFRKSGKDEFREMLPFEAEDSKNFLEAPTARRDFLKYLGFTTAAAAIAASCEVPVKKSIPFVNKPEDIFPGNAYYYATTYVEDGEAVSILAKVRDGRPIKIEGNELSPITFGGTSARVQGSVLDLYDTARLRYPLIDGKEVTLEAIDRSVLNAIGAASPLVLLTSTINSPTSLEIINQFLAKFPGSRHVMMDAVSYDGMLSANALCYGKRMIPSYRFDKAKTVVGIGADFLGTWLSPIEFANQYSKGKKINEKAPSMSHHIQFETVASLTGSNADDRYLHRPSETGAIAIALYNAVNGQAVTNITDTTLKTGIEKTAKELLANKGAALVVSGSNDINVQVIINSINETIGAGGNTIDWSSGLNYKLGNDADFAKLLDDMNAGTVGTLIVHGANPAYASFNAAKFASGIKKVKVSISLNPRLDETAQLCKYIMPDSHFLESWGDAEPKSGYYSLMQPTIYPLFKTRQWQDSLLKWSGANTDYLSFLKSYWTGKLGGEMAWDKALQDGVINPGGTIQKTPVTNIQDTAKAVIAPVIETLRSATFNGGAVATSINALGTAKKGGNIELVLYQKVGIREGKGITNPWLQEMPDPITKCTWDNYVIISPKMAKSLLKIDLASTSQSDDYEVHPEKHILKVSVGSQSIELPALIIPGTHSNVIGIALGYGRTDKIGKVAAGVGKNAYPFVLYNTSGAQYFQSDVQVTNTGNTYKVALTQTHNLIDTPMGNRVEVMKEMTLGEFKANPDEILNERDEELKPWGGLENYEKVGTMYPYYDKPGIHWGMSIDLNSCVGCGACVVACHLENNVPIVGKSEVMRFHDMHWMRIDRYYSGDMDNPKVVFQPLMCQHCNNAPCENVCPVSATNHSSEGLNQMAYNRCIGTRYCANNCPYKVRRFNWADYTGADSFPDNQDQTIVGVLDPAVHVMNDDLSRMVLNPDVTVRSRGVMEKCSFCVQRLQDGKLKAKRADRALLTGEDGQWDVKTACQQSCPTNAIVFGNINNSKSGISVERMENTKRNFYVLEQLHVMPNVNYLVKVRNTEEHQA
ncbi:MAG: TAT-variant-translocated molybdopterin oxidoreductase [Bacteroidetes bacterium]|nr:TAT-variant-translocated molybdopterin oxidoreductase [Bacteroidota bacterium]